MLFQKGHKINNGKHRSLKTEFKKGILPHNKGKKGYKNNGTFKKGHKRIGNNRGSFGKHWIRLPFSEKTKQKMRERMINNPNHKFKNTNIELKIETELQKRNINYQKQVPLCKVARVDFYLPEYRIVIQCDGDYWHNLPGHKERDEKQDKVLIFNGFNVYRFWEHEINESIENCINKLLL